MSNISFIEQQHLSNTLDDQSKFPTLIMGIRYVIMRHQAQDENSRKALLGEVSWQVELLG